MPKVCPKSRRKGSSDEHLDMSTKSNSKQKRKSSGSPSPKKRASSVFGMANPGAGAAKCIATAGESFPSAMIDLVGSFEFLRAQPSALEWLERNRCSAD